MSSNDQNISSPELCEIIGLPLDDLTHCHGQARSTRRRCRNPIGRDRRTEAARLLNLGTRMLRQGQPVDEILEDAVLRTLCWRHKDGASDLVDDWRTKVCEFQRHARVQSENTISIEGQSPRPAASVPSVTPRVNRTRNVDARNALSSPTSTSVQARETQRSPASSSRRTPVSRSSSRSSSRSRSSSFSSVSTSTSISSVATTPQTPNGARRQPIEGDCPICYASLRQEETEADDNEHTDDGSHLVWCKARCGANFHEGCLDHWAARCLDGMRDVTCPTCRSPWRD
ncbi:hypothetical protein MPDQ_007494 [Monascus purpureus]|uniref:RING-type domain-containing protein n=1 Tax=Monascus purpureus TaxID=5098 RepID=A0A507R2H0_MONPU|nr:hypothetical protein MPDQ_007494 [Monascus purpureus]